MKKFFSEVKVSGFKGKIIAALLTAVLLAACLVWAAPSSAPQPPSGPEKAEEPKVLARVEGQDITEADVLQVLQSMGPQAMMLYGSPEGREMVLNELISMRLFALDGAKAKLDETSEFKEVMERFRAQLLAQLDMREAIKDISITDAEARNFYDENQERFAQPERIHARHILFADDAASADVIAKAQADLAAGVSFDMIAKEVSICPSAPQGGDLGEFSRGQMVPEFEEAAFALKEPGDISQPVKSQFGWHIIKLEGRTPASTTPFDEAKPQILQELENAKTAEKLKAHADALRKVYKVEILSGDVVE